jgi:gamma-glutamyltranspeptidase / glutathione hydrolase
MLRRNLCFRGRICSVGLLILIALLNSASALAQSPPVRMCTEVPTPPWCSAVRGDRAEGWVPQTRSEVMARNGMVTTVGWKCN